MDYYTKSGVLLRCISVTKTNTMYYYTQATSTALSAVTYFHITVLPLLELMNMLHHTFVLCDRDSPRREVHVEVT